MLHDADYTVDANIRIYAFDTAIPVQVGCTQLYVLLNGGLN